MAAVRIVVGAASDGSMATVFRPLVEAAAAARKAIAAEFRGLKGDVSKALGTIPGAAAKAFAAITEMERKELEKQLAAVKEIESQKQKIREESGSGRRGGGGGGGVGHRDDGYRTALGTTRYMDRAVRGAGRTALDIAKGAGVDLDMGTIIGKSVHMGKLATDLSNSGWQPNLPKEEGESAATAASRNRVPESTLISEARAAGNKAALDPQKALSGMASFVGTSGDLDTARKIIGDLGVLARATGTEFDDMVSAAGEVAAKLGDVPNKGQIVLSVMKTLAGQGKLGAVEIKNMATEMAKVGSVAKSFNMSPEKAMQEMGILMQVARQSGGAKSASVAANSAMALIQTLTKGSTIKNLQKAGIQPFADKEKTKLLSPETMTLAMLYKSKGDLQQLGGMIKDTMAFRAVRGFATVYNEKKGTQAEKLDAVRAEFAKQRAAVLGEGAGGKNELETQFAASMQTSEAKVQLFNNKLSEIGDSIASRVLPALEKLAPTIVNGVEAFGKFVAWAAENPGKALAVALTASIARASLDTVLRAGIENLFKSANGGGGAGIGGGAGGKLSKGLMAAGMALTIAAAAITITQVGEMIIDDVSKKREGAKDSTEAALIGADNAVRAALHAKKGGTADVKTLNALQAEKDKLDARVADAENMKKEGWKIGSGVWSWLGGEGDSFSHQNQSDADARRLDELKAEQVKLEAAMRSVHSALTGGVLRVEVVSGTTASPAGTSPGRK